MDLAETERLALCDPDGRLTGALAPRWLAHLLGLPHATAHVGLVTPSGLVLLQRRSRHKAQFPNAWDMAVTGHVSLPADAPPRPVTAREAAARELEEELGVTAALLEGGLEPVGAPRASFAQHEEGPRPWCDVEVRQLFGAVLGPAGLAALAYQETELSGVLLCRPADALESLRGPDAAAGALESLRDLLAWRKCHPGPAGEL